ncbi:hypothetical protein E0493_11140 [Roseomonas sp. M0104]|uniref:Uncharacterized protein n=1 Tax=Teichococcus coralli TaxID=2545983 RepID=A0A845BCP0_9PROT|nr:hypothetical protein [Pseudoroseomonas coralli]MXP63900.1 hypothetical protein [Pseudoroseomonas coralli]
MTAKEARKAINDRPAGGSRLVRPPTDQPNNPLRDLGGSRCASTNEVLVRETLSALWSPPGEPEEEQLKKARAVSQALAAFRPRDEIEGMLAAQAVALHFGAMECLRRAMVPNQPFETAAKLRKDGANLARAMTDMVEALNRKRGKGPQVVRVERVVVQEGGQAIVGNVQPAGRAEGGV